MWDNELVERVVELAARYVLGPGGTAGVTMGPLIDDDAVEAMRGFVDRALGAGATLVCGGDRPDDPTLERGAYFGPTLLTDVARGSELATDPATFGH